MKKRELILFTCMTIFGPLACADHVAQTSDETPRIKDTQDQATRFRAEYLSELKTSQITGTPPEGMGFLQPDSLSLPEGVRRSAKSVFTLAVPGGDLISVSKAFPNLSLNQAIEKLKSMPQTEDFGPVEREMYVHQIRACIQKNQSESECQLFEGIEYGTGFVTGDGRDLRTALHVVEDFCKVARTRGASGSIPVFILDSKGQIKFSPANLNATVAATYEGALDADVWKGKDMGKFNLDQVLIKLSVPVASPIPIGYTPLQDGESAFIAGAPKETKDRALFGAEDSDGTSVRVSRGTVMGPRNLMERLERSGLYTNETTAAKTLEEGMSLTADGAPRASGGAILNASGQVVGVYIGGYPESGTANPMRISYGSKSLIEVK